MARRSTIALVLALTSVASRAAAQNGEVVIDGQARVPLQNGVAHVELGPGNHSIEVLPNEVVRVPFPTRKVVAGTLTPPSARSTHRAKRRTAFAVAARTRRRSTRYVA